MLKEWSGMLLDVMMFNKGCLLIIIYKVCIGDVIQTWLDQFSQYVLPCECWHHPHDSGVCMHLHWCSLMMITSIKVVFLLSSTKFLVGYITELTGLIFPICPVMLLLASPSWQWCMYAFTLMFIVNDNFNKGHLLIITHKLLIGDGIQNWVD